MKHLGIAQDVPNAENRHIRLKFGQPVTLSRTPEQNGGAAAGVQANRPTRVLAGVPDLGAGEIARR